MQRMAESRVFPKILFSKHETEEKFTQFGGHLLHLGDNGAGFANTVKVYLGYLGKHNIAVIH